MRVFISHAHEDDAAAHQIAAALSRAGLDPWLDVQQLQPGHQLLERLAAALNEVDYYAVVLTRAALASPWVLTELRIALTSEIERNRPRVIVLLLDEVDVPIEVRHKVHLDFRGRFDAALDSLADHINGVTAVVPTPKQAIVADMVGAADTELWARLSAGRGSAEEWSQQDAADVIRRLRSVELEAAVSIASVWSDDKLWDDDLLRILVRAANCSPVLARSLRDTLVDRGFIVAANDLDYGRNRDRAWFDGSLLWILRRAARRSGLFPALGLPLPERLSSFLAYQSPLQISGKGWYAVRFANATATSLEPDALAIAVVARHEEPARTWAFRSHQKTKPLKVERYAGPAEIDSDPPIGRESARFGFGLSAFDDLCLLE
jgi:hypothetical protein